jgi:hypothetical protein
MFVMLRKISGTGKQAISTHNKYRWVSLLIITLKRFKDKYEMLNALNNRAEKFINNGVLIKPNESDSSVTNRCRT